MTPYVVEHCTCGHAKGDHKSSGSQSLIVNYGVCLIDGCDCTVFTARVDEPADLLPARESDWILILLRDRLDVGLVKGAEIVVRQAADPGDALLAVVVVNGEHVLRRTPVTEGKVVGIVLGRLEEIPDGD